jgi:hypothetical protein
MSANSQNGAIPPQAPILLTIAIEGDPGQMCRRTAYGSQNGLVLFELKLLTLCQPQVANLLREVANQFAAKEGAIAVVTK